MDEGSKRDDERLDRLRREAKAAAALADRVAANAETDLGIARAQIKTLRQQNAALVEAITGIRASTSWRLTAPLRKVLTALRQSKPGRGPAANGAGTDRTLAAPRVLARGGEAMRDHRPPPKRTEAVDVIVCVHNALADVQACLASVMAQTAQPWRLILVDDGSGPETQAFLAEFAAANGATLIRNEAARGYTFAANQGMRAATAPWLVLLNSDTVVTPLWLDRMVAAAVADPKVGMVGPMSNTASWQSAPKIYERGDWADNPLPQGMSVADMGALVEAVSIGQAMPLPFLNGFCMLLRRAMLDEVGLFDEETFGAGYGEENDLSIRARHAGWKLMVASGAYVFHAQSKSYSHERRKALAERAGRRLAAKHDAVRDIDLPVEFCRDNPAMAATRGRIGAAIERDRLVRTGRTRWAGRKLAFMLPVDREGGGGNVVRQEAHALTRMGVDWRIVNLEQNRADFAESYPDLLERTLFAASPEAATELLADPAHGFEVAVASYYTTAFWLPRGERPRPAYYVQDFEPLFFDEGDPAREVAARSYTAFEDFGLFTKSRWNAEAVEQGAGVRPVVIGPSVDIDLFRPQPRPYDEAGAPVRVCAMVRPATPRRGPGRTLEVLNRLQARFGAGVEVSVFGCDDGEIDPFGIPLGGAINYQRMDRGQMAWLLERSDVFLDFSDYQAMGLTALEAMASGCATVLPIHGGARDFVRDEHNALLVDTTDVEECAAAAERLVADTGLRRRLQAQGAADACLYPPEVAAYRMMEALFG